MNRRMRFELSEEDRDFLEKTSKSRTEKAVRVQRSQILLKYADKMRITAIAAMFRTNRPWDRAMASGIQQAWVDLRVQVDPP